MVKGLEGKPYGLVTVGERGQIVIPQEARTAFDIKPRDKLVIFGFGTHAGLIILKAEALEQVLSRHLEHISSLRQALKESK